MYVFHKPLHDFVGKPVLAKLGFVPDTSAPLAVMLAYMLAMGLATLAAGMFSYWLYERHFLALKGRFAAREPPTPASAGGSRGP
jgi:peptidoglycan/LPS O-acetylase OafA/YrhL